LEYNGYFFEADRLDKIAVPEPLQAPPEISRLVMQCLCGCSFGPDQYGHELTHHLNQIRALQ
jgi:hypothetical protein